MVLVEIGNAAHLSRILAPGETPRLGAQVVQVPQEYLEPCHDVEALESMLRELAGVPIRDPNRLRRLKRKRK
jgi:hypothetical protein